MNNNKLSPANIVILAAGAVMLVASFLSFYEFSLLGRSVSFNAWSGADGFGIFGVATVIVLCGVVMAAQVGVETFAAGVDLPDKPLGLTWDQVHLVLGFQALLMMLAFLIRSKSALDFGIGFWLMMLSAIALFVGAIMRMNEAGSKPRSV